MAINERTNLVGNIPRERRHLNWKGALAVFFAALGIFSIAVVCARSVFPRVVMGRTASSPSSMGVASFSKVDGPVLFEDEIISTLAPVHVTTEECSGNRELPVVKGVDVVAYFSLEGAQPAVYGTDRFSVKYNGYLFFFSSHENKMLFEADPVKYLPAWGGFCSYGISHEVVWNAEILGPKANPDAWLIVDGQLYLFHGSVPLGKFTHSMTENIDHGNAVWHEWFGKDNRDVDVLTPFNTACFCSIETCTDK